MSPASAPSHEVQDRRDADYFNRLGREHLPEYLGVVVTDVEPGVLRAELPLRQALFAPNGFVHAGSVVTLADTAAGYACVAHLPDGAETFTTLELKANFLRTAREGVLRCEARAIHLGRTTHVRDATVCSGDDERPIALFRCTQLVLYPT
jgi:1,4-dihydroxy-2-naphthoyl-CoA hydrolase